MEKPDTTRATETVLPFSRPLHVLLVEDSPADAALIVATLKRAGYPVQFDVVAGSEGFQERLRAETYDVVLCDHNLITWMGMDALGLLQAWGRDIPFVVVTATLGDEAAVEYIKHGAADYVLKHRLERLPIVVGQVLRDKAHRDEERSLQEAILCAKRDWELTFDTVPDPIFMLDGDCRVRRANRAASELVGLPFSELVGRACAEIVGPLSRPIPDCPHQDLFAATEPGGVRTSPQGQVFESSCAPVRDATGTLRGCVHVLRDVSEWQRAEQAIRESERKYRELIEHTSYGVFRSTQDGRFLEVNPALVKILGYASKEEVLALNAATDVYRNPPDRLAVLQDYALGSGFRRGDLEWKRKDGSIASLRTSGREVRDGGGNAQYYEVMVEDVTQQRALEDQLRQAQKMEAVGRLAGGVAHDFNNLVAVIMGNADLLLDLLPAGEKTTQRVSDIKAAAKRAAELTQRLLAFSRKQVLEPRVIDLNSVIRDTGKLLVRLLGEDITVVTRLEPHLGAVKADPAQIEQAFMNLVINARDAMPGGGTLTIESGNVELDEMYCRGHDAVVPGPYVMLAVSDTGTGMDEETKARVFEPFFTTKELGRGTGLGLAMVYGFVRQSGGAIWVYSEPGQGATFKIYLPRVEAREPRFAPDTREAGCPGGTETILIVEDEAALLQLNAEVLRSVGYRVLCAANGSEALNVAALHPGRIDLLLTDVVMPDLSGHEVAQRMREIRPGIPALYTSGYTRDDILRRGVMDDAVGFLQKPFTRETLTGKVRAVLDAHASANVLHVA